MDLNEAKNAVIRAINDNQEKITAVGRHIWENPEPGYREFKTSAYLVSILEELGLEVKTGLAVTGFRADIDTGRPGPTIAVLGELDSLILPNHPECFKETGAVHACGHNASAASLIGTAVGLLKSGILDSLCGKIALIATPAEEGIELDYRKDLMRQGKIKSIAGKSQLLREGVFNDVDISFMHHLSNHFGYNDHNGCVNKKITFHGCSCHAARPQSGHNALNASTLALNAIAMLREVYSNDPYIRIHGIITNGGDSVNIIPDTVTMEYMLRAPTVETTLSLNERFDNAVMYAAKAAECEADIETVNGYMPLYDDEALGKVIGGIAEELHPEIKYDYNTSFYASCTDMGDIATVIPAVHAYNRGGKGTAHGIDYGIEDEYASYIESSLINALTTVELLFNDAEKGKTIAAHKKDLMPIEEYIKVIDSINRTVSSRDL